MATRVGTVARIDAEHRFFLITAILMAAVIVGGFSVNLAFGRSSFAVPLLVHVHAFVFFGWTTLYLLQNALVATGSVQMHRRLGWAALAFLPAMAVLGPAMTIYSLRSSGGPPFFFVPEFLIGNPLTALYFVGVAGAAIVMRRRTDWHRRLMYCAMAALTGPGFGRLLPVPLMIPWSWWVTAFVAPALFPLAGIAFDAVRSRRVHRAWWWGLGLLVAVQLVTALVAHSPVGDGLARAALAGSPGAGREFAAHFP